MSGKLLIGVSRRQFLASGARAAGGVGLASLLYACGVDGGSATTLAATPTTGAPRIPLLRIRTLAVVNFAALLRLSDTAAEHGLTVELRTFPSGTEALDALLAGELEAAPTGQTQPIILRSQGAPIKIVSALNRRGMGLITGPEVATFDDLRGQAIGIVEGSGPAIVVRVKLEDEGLDPDVDVELVSVPFPEMAAAVQTGQVAGAAAAEPFISGHLLAGGKLLSDLGDTRLGAADAMMNVTDDFIARDPEAVQVLVDGLKAAVLDLQDPDVVVQTMLNHGDFDEEVLRKSLENAEPTTMVNLDELAATADAMAELGIIDTVPTTDEYTDLSFLEG